MGRLNDIASSVSDRVAVKNKVLSQLNDLEKKAKVTKIQKIRKERALELVKDVALKTQSQLEFHISDMVSAGLNTVFDTVYDFKVQFVIRRGKTECDLFFEKDGDLAQPKYSGGGAMDIAAFCLRCAAWSMTKQYRPFMLLDEPFKHLKGEKENIRAIQLMKTLSHELKLQIICINDERASREDIVNNADRVFYVSQRKGVSSIKVLC